MKNYLRITQPTEVYEKHELQSRIIKTLQPDTLVPYNREKRRDKINWMEIYLEDGSTAYILKKKGDLFEVANFFRCDFVKMTDQTARGFEITYKTEERPPIYELFFPEGTLNKDEVQVEKIRIETQPDSDKSKKIHITLEYNAGLIEAKTVEFTKGDQFYITYQTLNKNDIFMEVDDLSGKHGYLLKKTNTSKLEDLWIMPVAVIVMIAVVLGLIISILSTGWLVISGLMIIPALIVAFIAIFVIQLCLLILKGIFNQIRKRF